MAYSPEAPRALAEHHQTTPEVNPDASLSFAVRGTRAHVQHVCGAPEELIGSVGPLGAVPHVGTYERNLAHNKRCLGRNRSRSGPARGNGRTEKTGRSRWPVEPRHTDVDEKGHEWDTAPAYVLGTMWGVAPMRTCQGWIGAAPVLNQDRDLAHLLQLAM
jgi:hypothetical protein